MENVVNDIAGYVDTNLRNSGDFFMSPENMKSLEV